MASRLSRGIAKTVRGRWFSSQVQLSEARQQPAQVTKLSNGLLVASIENYSAVSRITVAVKAGARYESGNQLGLTHVLRHLPEKPCNRFSDITFMKGLQQLGASFYCSNSREYMFYTVESSRADIGDAVEFLEDVSVNPFINKWDVEALTPNLEFDVACIQNEPISQSLDALHTAAFRTGLGRSLYIPEFMIGKYSSDEINDYSLKNYTPDNMAVIGYGIDHEELVNRAQAINFNTFGGRQRGPSAPKEKAVYKGGEVRIPSYSNQTVASVAVEGPSLCEKDLLAAQVLQNVICHQSAVKYGANNSKIVQAISKVTNEPFDVSCFNMSYTDNGLFGFTAAAKYNNIKHVLRAAFDQFVTLSKGGISQQEVARAKTQLKSALFMSYEDGGYVLDDLCEQVLCHEKYTSPQEIAKQIDAVSVKDVEAVAKKIGRSKPSMGIVGNLSEAPYLDELYK